MKSLSEIDTTSKRASRAAGYSWGISEEVGKNIRMLEMFGLPGIKNLNDYYKKKKKSYLVSQKTAPMLHFQFVYLIIIKVNKQLKLFFVV